MSSNPNTLAIIEPVTTRTLIKEGSFENTTLTYWIATSGTGVALTTAEARFGQQSARVSSAGATASLYQTLSLVAGQAYTFSVYLKGNASATYQLVFADGTTAFATRPFNGTGEWKRDWLTATIAKEGWAEGETVSVRCYIKKTAGDSGGAFYVDGVQVEDGPYVSTYCDGDQPYCSWDGTAHLSTATRKFARLYKAGERDIGRLVVLHQVRLPVPEAPSQDPSGQVLGAYFLDGFGTPDTEDISIRQPLGGAYHQGLYIQEREMAATYYVTGATPRHYRQLRRALERLVAPELVAGNSQFTLLWLDDEDPRDAVILQVKAILTNNPFRYSKPIANIVETLLFEFRAHYPYWRSFEPLRTILDTTTTLIPNVSALLGYEAADDAWNNAGQGVRLSSGSSTETDPRVWALAFDLDGNVLAGGEAIEWAGPYAGGVNARGLARLNPASQTWESLGLTSATFPTTGIIYAIAVDPATGDIYIGGTDIVIDGVDFHSVARWDAEDETWEQMGQGLVSLGGSDPEIVYCLHIEEGILYAGGRFRAIAALSGDPYTDPTFSPAIAAWDLDTHTWTAISEPDGDNILTNPSFDDDTEGYTGNEAGITALLGDAAEGPAYCLVQPSTLSTGGGISRMDLLLDTGRSYRWKAFVRDAEGEGFAWRVSLVYGGERVVVINEPLTAIIDGWIELTHSDVLPGSVTVTNEAEDITYVESLNEADDGDYLVDYGLGRIRPRSTGDIEAAQTLFVDFSHKVLSNSGFELTEAPAHADSDNPSEIKGWAIVGAGDIQVTTDVPGRPARDGENVALIGTDIPNAYAGIMQEITLGPRATYSLTYYQAGLNSATGSHFKIQIYDSSADAVIAEEDFATTVIDIWKQMTLTFATSDSEHYELRVLVSYEAIMGGGDPGGLVDKFEIRRTDLASLVIADGEWEGDTEWVERSAIFDIPADEYPTSIITYTINLRRNGTDAEFDTDFWRLGYLGGPLGGPSTVRAIAADDDGNLYLGGGITVAGSRIVSNVVKWLVDETRWVGLGSGVPAMVRALFYDVGRRLLLASGEWTIASHGALANYWLKWNGRAWSAMHPDAPDGPGYAIAQADDGTFHMVGDFTEAGGATISDDGYVIWDGADDFTSPTIDAPNGSVTLDTLGPTGSAILLDEAGNAFFGFGASGQATAAARATIDYPGTAQGFPIFEMTRVAGGGAVTLVELANVGTGVRLGFNYAFAEGETLTIDTRRDVATIVSSRYGLKMDALTDASASDFADFFLIPETENEIAIFTQGDLTALQIVITVYAEYDSIDGVA